MKLSAKAALLIGALLGCTAEKTPNCAGTLDKFQNFPIRLEVILSQSEMSQNEMSQNEMSQNEMYQTGILSAASQIETQTGLHLFEISTHFGTPVLAQDKTNVVAFLYDWELDKRNEQGRTTSYWIGNSISENDIRINVRDFRYFVGDKPDPTRVSLESLFMHELSHAIGLQHNVAPGSIMNPTLPYGYVRTKMSAADISAVQCLALQH